MRHRRTDRWEIDREHQPARLKSAALMQHRFMQSFGIDVI